MFQDDEDAYVLSKIADVIHSFFGTHKESFLPVFEQIMPYFQKLIVSETIFVISCHLSPEQKCDFL